MKSLLPVLISMLILCGATPAGSGQKEREKEDPARDFQNRSGKEVDLRHHVKNPVTGEMELVAHIRGNSIQPTREGPILLVDPVVEYFTEKRENEPSQTIRLRAEEATYSDQDGTLDLSGNVTARTDNGDHFATRALSVSLDKGGRAFRSPAPFLIAKPDADIRGTGFEADESLRTIDIRKDARVKIGRTAEKEWTGKPESETFGTCLSSRGPLTLIETVFESPSGISTIRIDARDDVRMEREHPDGLLVTTCDIVEIEARKLPPPENPSPKETAASPEGPRSDFMIDRLLATGRVAISQEDKIDLRGDEARWDGLEEIFHLVGKEGVRGILQGKDFSAHEARFDRHHGLVHLDGEVLLNGRFNPDTEPFEVNAHRVTWNPATESGFLDGAPLVILKQPGKTVSATRVHIRPGGGIILQGRKLIHQEDDRLTIRATSAGDALYDPTAGRLSMKDHCRIRTGSFTLACERLRIGLDGPLLEAADDIILKRTAAPTNASPKEQEGAKDLVLVGNRLHYDVAVGRGWITGTRRVLIFTSGGRVEATRVLFSGEDRILLQGGKHFHFQEEGRRMEATCRGNAWYDAPAGQILLNDDCRVRTEDLRLFCDRMRIHIDGPRLNARGDVRVEQASAGLILYGDALRHDGTDVILLRGAPHVVAATSQSVHFWGPTEIDTRTRRIRTRSGSRTCTSIIHSTTEQRR